MKKALQDWQRKRKLFNVAQGCDWFIETKTLNVIG